MKNSYINKMGQVIQPKDLEKTADEINALKKVVANPMLVGTEPELTGIEIGGTKYKAGGGGEIPTITIQNVTSGSVSLLKADGTKETVSTAGTYANVVAIILEGSTITYGAGYTYMEYLNIGGTSGSQSQADIPVTDIIISDITSGGENN